MNLSCGVADASGYLVVQCISARAVAVDTLDKGGSRDGLSGDLDKGAVAPMSMIQI